VIIKTPIAYDTSYWEGVPDFALVTPRPLYVATRATLGLDYTDPSFVRYFTDLGYDNIRRGCYHAFKKAYNATDQAKKFCNAVSPYVNDRDVLELDFEEGGETAAQLLEWLRYVKGQFPHNIIMVYSRKNLMDPISMTASQAQEMQQYPVWVAGYPYNPDLYNTVPSWYIPNPTRWGAVWMWQYSENGVAEGITGEVDLNWLSPEFIAWLSGEAPAADVTTTLYDGVLQIAGVRHGWKFWLQISDPTKIHYEVVHPSALSTVSFIARLKAAQLAWNGGEWDRVSMPKDYSVSGGSVYVPRKEAVPSFIALNGGTTVINHQPMSGVKHAISGLRYLINDGALRSYLFGTEPQYTEGHSRSIHGLRADGHHMVLTSEGVYPNQGLTLKQAAEIMKEYGAVIAFDSGGGGDATVVIDGILLNKPEDISNGVNVERRLPQILVAYANTGEPMSTYTVTAPALATVALRPDHNTNNTSILDIPKGTVMQSDTIFTATTELRNSAGTVYQMAGDRWARVVFNSRAGWVACVHKGMVICTVTENVPPAPTDTLPDVLWISTKADGSDKKEYRKAV